MKRSAGRDALGSDVAVDRGAPTPLRMLLLEDDPADAELVLHELRWAGFALTWERVEDEAGYRAGVIDELDIILADDRLAGFDAMRALELLRQTGLDVPLIVVSGSISEEVAVMCMRRGAADYLLKDRLGRLGEAVRRAIAERETRREKRRADEALRLLYATERAARTEAEDAIRARDEFLSVAAHELKTPLTSLQGAVQLLRRQADKGAAPDPQQLGWALRLIERQTQKLGRLVTHLLDTSRIDAGKLDLHPTVEDLTALVTAVVAQAQARTTIHVLEVRAPLAILARVDAPRLEQVVTNLLDNAVKFSPDGGTIEVELAIPDAATVRLIVSDHGIGVPAERRAHIFDPFYQAHADSHRSGLGLGLYVSRGIIELHGGKIDVEFPEHGGTRFLVSLPRKGAAVLPE